MALFRFNYLSPLAHKKLKIRSSVTKSGSWVDKKGH